MTKGELAVKILGPDVTYDCALPQHWVDEMQHNHGFDVRPHFVWGYPERSLWGGPVAITEQGQAFADQMGFSL